MSIWTRIWDAVSALVDGEPLSAVFEKLRTPPERSVGFTIAVIALGAKMAKADGQVTRDEVRAFREVFYIAPEDEAAAARVFNLARTDVAGYDGYARQIARMFSDDPGTLEMLLEGLFHVASADGGYHPEEDAFLQDVAAIFGMQDPCFRAMRARYAPDDYPDPYGTLGVDPAISDAALRDHWRMLVRETHPDRLIAHGVPEEAVKLATTRLAAINKAYEEITLMRKAEPVA